MSGPRWDVRCRFALLTIAGSIGVAVAVVFAPERSLAAQDCCHPKYEEWGKHHPGTVSAGGKANAKSWFTSPSKLEGASYAMGLHMTGGQMDSWANYNAKGQGSVRMYTATCPNWSYHWWGKGSLKGIVRATARSGPVDSAGGAISGSTTVSGYVSKQDQNTAAARDGGDSSVSLTVAGPPLQGAITYQPQTFNYDTQPIVVKNLSGDDTKEGPGHEVYIAWEGHVDMAVRAHSAYCLLCNGELAGNVDAVTVAAGNPKAKILEALFCKSPGGLYTVTQWDPANHRVRVGTYPDGSPQINWGNWEPLDPEDPDYTKRGPEEQPPYREPASTDPDEWEHPQ